MVFVFFNIEIPLFNLIGFLNCFLIFYIEFRWVV